jgi:hypothetical protein
MPKTSSSKAELRRRNSKKNRSSPRPSSAINEGASLAELSPAAEEGQLLTESSKGRQSMLSIPTDDSEDYIFWRLSRKLKGQWHKLSQQLVEKYPQGLFQRRATTALQAAGVGDAHPAVNGITATSSQGLTPVLSNASYDSIGSTSQAAKAAFSEQGLAKAQNFAKSLLESLFTIPQLSQRRDEEDRKGIPLITAFLRVHDTKWPM